MTWSKCLSMGSAHNRQLLTLPTTWASAARSQCMYRLCTGSYLGVDGARRHVLPCPRSKDSACTSTTQPLQSFRPGQKATMIQFLEAWKANWFAIQLPPPWLFRPFIANLCHFCCCFCTVIIAVTGWVMMGLSQLISEDGCVQLASYVVHVVSYMGGKWSWPRATLW